MIYETDTDLTYIWGGSAWQQVSGGTAVGNSGLVFVKQQTISTTPAATVVVTDAFSATYDNYRIQISNCLHTASGGNMFMTLSGAATGWYSNVAFTQAGYNAWSLDNVTNGVRFYIGITDTGTINLTTDLYSPFLAKQKSSGSNYISSGSDLYTGWAGAHTGTTTSSTGFTLSASSGNYQGGIITIYGYRKS
jgi:hypothetical protein